MGFTEYRSNTTITDKIDLEKVKCIVGNLFKYNEVTHWEMKGGKRIAIKDMTDTHLTNTIKMLRRQIDGSLHDEFCYDNIISMEKELERRKLAMNIPFTPGQVVYVIEKHYKCHYDRIDRGYDHLGHRGYDKVEVVDGHYYQVEETKFHYGLLDKYGIDGIYTNKLDAEKEMYKMSKIQNVDLKVVGVTFTNEDTGEKRSDIIRELMEKNPSDIKVELVREPDNMYDANAIKVLADSKQIGYIGKEYATIMAPLMDEYEEFAVTVKGIGEYKNRPYCEVTINQL